MELKAFVSGVNQGLIEALEVFGIGVGQVETPGRETAAKQKEGSNCDDVGLVFQRQKLDALSS